MRGGFGSFQIKGGRKSGKKRRGVRRQDACHDITKSADFQTMINFSENDCIIAKILHTKTFIKPMTSV